LSAPRRLGVVPGGGFVAGVAAALALVAGAAATAPATPNPLGAPAGQQVSGGDGTIYMAGYDKAIHVIDEATMAVVGRIEATTGILRDLQLSADRRRFYARSVDFEHIEVFDIEAGVSLGAHTFSEGNSKVRISSFVPHPEERYLLVLTSTDTKLVDRWQIDEPVIRQYDTETREFVREFPWPDGEVRENANLMFSPDGKLLYFFADEVLVYDFETFEEVDRWDISTPFETGMNRLNLGFNRSLYEEPGFFTGLFRTTDPVNDRSMMGVARINLPEKSVDFYTLGPSVGVSFALAADRKKAYGLRQQIGDYEVWTFDLENRRVASRRSFPGRPRMSLQPSSNGRFLYIYNAGNTIDVYDAESFDFVRTVELDADMTAFVVLPAAAARNP
jgi:WD40 repeat protein